MSFLVDITETKSFMQVTSTATDSLISTYIDLVESEIEVVIGRSLALATYTEVPEYQQSRFDQSAFTPLDVFEGTPVLFLKNYPVVSIASVVLGSSLPTTSYTFEENGVFKPTYATDNATVTYVAGYTTVTAPSDLKYLTFLGVTSLFQNNSAASQGIGNVKSKRIKDFSVDYGSNQNSYLQGSDGDVMKTYLASNQHILRKYQDVRL